MDPIKAAIEEIKSLPYDQSFTFSEIARKYGVVRSTLIRRYKAITEPRTVKAVKQHALTPDQEIELVAG
jgi:DNA-binding transcriptional regulator LsrR (DeoR family)